MDIQTGPSYPTSYLRWVQAIDGQKKLQQLYRAPFRDEEGHEFNRPEEWRDVPFAQLSGGHT